MIYFMRHSSHGPIKIGHAVNVDRRKNELRKRYGRTFVVVRVEPGGSNEEKVIHRRFADLRFPKTEFFRPGPSLMAYLDLAPLSADVWRNTEAPKRKIRVWRPLPGVESPVPRPNVRPTGEEAKSRGDQNRYEILCYDLIAEAIEAASNGNKARAIELMNQSNRLSVHLVNDWTYNRVRGAAYIDIAWYTQR